MATGIKEVRMTARNVSPTVRALEYHGRICQHCAETARSGRPYRELCVVGRLLAECAFKARARRRAS